MVKNTLPWDVLMFVALFGLHLLALFVKPTPYRSLIFLPICAIVTYLMLSTNKGDSTPLRGSSIASVALPILFSASDFIFLTDVQRQLRRKGQTVPAEKLEWKARLCWAFALFSSPRGIGWEHEPRHVIRPLPASVCASRWSFVKAQMLRLVVYAALLDILRWHDCWNPCYAKDGPSITAFGWMWRGFSMFSWSIQTYIQIDRLYWVLGSLSVLCAEVLGPHVAPAVTGGARFPRKTDCSRRTQAKSGHAAGALRPTGHGVFHIRADSQWDRLYAIRWADVLLVGMPDNAGVRKI
ncbi:hypothetical protein APHAL10511_006953 [Amanita phalloides]|nr:hypothetical protein APHAL10511_006953 [Amanita phalloides]